MTRWERFLDRIDRFEHRYVRCPRISKGYKCKGDYRVCRMD